MVVIQRLRNLLRLTFNMINPILDPLRALRALFYYSRYFLDQSAYKGMPNSEPVLLRNAFPQLHDVTKKTPIDFHYFNISAWAIRRILQNKPDLHVDVGSHNIFVSMLSAVCELIFVDYRPLPVTLDRFYMVSGDLLNLPFPDKSIDSLSCLHVAEHIGLGRYGDSLNPNGTRLACSELNRVLAPGGRLYFAVPIGAEAVHFNAHRVHLPETIMQYFGELTLAEFCGVTDSGQLVKNPEPSHFNDSVYACGMFTFCKNINNKDSFITSN